MNSFEEVNQILESGPLSEGLSRLEQFAKANKGRGAGQAEADIHKQGEAKEELARWASTELNGWEGAGNRNGFPEYRRIPIQRVDRLGRPLQDTDGRSVVVEMPVLYGVRNLEQHLRKGMTTFHEEGPQGSGIRIEAQQIGVLFQAIRNEARRRLAETLPTD